MPVPPTNEKKNTLTLDELMRMYDFTGKTVAITGGVGILGSEFACALVGCGANVAILDINLNPGKALLERMGKRASQAELFQCDVRLRQSANESEMADRHGSGLIERDVVDGRQRFEERRPFDENTVATGD